MFTKMGKQIGVAVILFVMVIECLILYASYRSRKHELLSLRTKLERGVVSHTSKNFKYIHPNVLSDQYINDHMATYLKNVIFLSLIIAVFTAVGTMYVFDYYVGKHIIRLKRLNTMNRGVKVARWRLSHEIPNNEVGELITEREELLDRIEESGQWPKS